ncbi:MAG: pyridoxal phosphate-dependent decarboxylase family protein, partial [Phycisphaerales bacterium]
PASPASPAFPAAGLGFVGFDQGAFHDALEPVAQWAIHYMDSLKERDVTSPIKPDSIRQQIPSVPPQTGMLQDADFLANRQSGWQQLTHDVRSIIEPGLMHWQSPRFFAYFPCGSSLPGVMAEMVSAVLNVNGMLWSTSPASTELEMSMMDWCAQLFGLPDQFRFDREGSIGGGCIQGTASEAVLAAIVAARRKKTRLGVDRSKVCVYTSTQAHSSMVKAAMIAGLADTPDDDSRVRLIAVDEHLAMDPDALLQAINADIQAGRTPAMISLTLGTTSTGASDPLRAIGEMLQSIPESDRPWLHVDAAWAGAASICPEHRAILDGIEYADSLCINPHKWLLTNFDCDLFWVRDRHALVDSMSITPAYLRDTQSDSGEVIDYRDWHVPLGRRLRAMKLWFVIRYFGVDGLCEHIRRHIQLAQQFEDFVKANPNLVLACDRSLSLICFYLDTPDDRTQELIDRVNARRRVMISHTIVPVHTRGQEPQSRAVARVAVGSSSVTADDIATLIEEIQSVVNDMIRP